MRYRRSKHGQQSSHPKRQPFCASALLELCEDFSQQINTLPDWPANIAVDAIAGDVTFTLPLFFTTVTGDTNSDLVVSKNSALRLAKHPGEGGGTAEATCDFDPAGALLKKALGSEQKMPNCWHSALTHNPVVEHDVVAAIQKYLTTTTVTCSPRLLFQAAASKEHFNQDDPSYASMGAYGNNPGAYGAICDEGWAVTNVRRPNVGTTDRDHGIQDGRGRDLGRGG